MPGNPIAHSRSDFCLFLFGHDYANLTPALFLDSHAPARAPAGNIFLEGAFGPPLIPAAGLANAGLLYLLSRKGIRKPIKPVALDSWEAITDEPGALLGLLALAVAPYLGTSLWKISAAFALALLAILVLRGLTPLPCGENPKTGRQWLKPFAAFPGPLRPLSSPYALDRYGVTAAFG